MQQNRQENLMLCSFLKVDRGKEETLTTNNVYSTSPIGVLLLFFEYLS